MKYLFPFLRATLLAVLLVICLPSASQSRSRAKNKVIKDTLVTERIINRRIFRPHYGLPSSEFPAERADSLRAWLRKDEAHQRHDALLYYSILLGETYADYLPDSLPSLVQRMRLWQAADPEEPRRALWHLVLGRLHGQWADEMRADVRSDSLYDVAAAHFREAFANLRLLARTPMTDYQYAVSFRQHDDLFDHDLLHVFYYSWRSGRQQAPPRSVLTFAKLMEVYKAEQREGAVRVLLLDSLTEALRGAECQGEARRDARFRQVDSLVQAWQNDSLAVYAYALYASFSTPRGGAATLHNDSLIYALLSQGAARFAHTKGAQHLRELLAERSQPMAQWQKGCAKYAPGSTLHHSVICQNVRRVRLCLHRFPTLEPTNENDTLGLPLTEHRCTADCMAWADLLTDTLPPGCRAAVPLRSTLPQEPGCYKLRVWADGLLRDTVVLWVVPMQPVSWTTKNGGTRLRVLDTLTGYPLPGAEVRVTWKDDEVKKNWVGKTDSLGALTFPPTVRSDRVYIRMPGDTLAFPFELHTYYRSTPQQQKAEAPTTEWMTDRAIYRPGQTMKFAITHYQKEGDARKVLPHRRLKAYLCNSLGEIIATMPLRTDEFGSAAAQITLPENCRPDQYYLTLDPSHYDSGTQVVVEQYRRPLLRVDLKPYDSRDALGDTLVMHGTATWQSGMPAAGAAVSGKVEAFYGWRHRQGGPDTWRVLPDTTDADGHFRLRIVTTPQKAAKDQYLLRRPWTSSVYVRVTTIEGESQTAEALLPANAHEHTFYADMPELLCHHIDADSVAVTLHAETGELPDESLLLRYAVCDAHGQALHSGTQPAGRTFKLPPAAQWPVGKYTLQVGVAEKDFEGKNDPAASAADTLRTVQRIRIISTDDRTFYPEDGSLVTYTHYNAARDTLTLIVGTPARHALLYTDYATSEGLIESHALPIDSAWCQMVIPYRASYGHALHVSAGLWHKQDWHSCQHTLEKPQPDRRLRLKWTAFRSLTTPGASEEWRLHVAMPDGSPAQAQVAVTVYDASLNIFWPCSWQSSALQFTRRLGWLDVSASRFARDFYYSSYTRPWQEGQTAWPFTFGSLRINGYNPFQYFSRRSFNEATYCCAFTYLPKARIKADGALTSDTPTDNDIDQAVRRTFAETAYFSHNLRTNGQGEVRIPFSMPADVATWQVKVAAHDKTMHYGTLDTTMVTRKPFTAELGLPRQACEGDSVQAHAKLSNFTDAPLQVSLVFTLQSPSGDTLSQQTVQTCVQPQAMQVVRLPFVAPQGMPSLLCRCEASTSQFADGEERSLPVMPSRQTLTLSRALSLKGEGTHTWAIDSLLPVPQGEEGVLTVETCSMPLWHALQSLPTLYGEHTPKSTTAWASRIYALALAQHVAKVWPHLARWARQHPASLAQLTAGSAAKVGETSLWARQARDMQQAAERMAQLMDPKWASHEMEKAVDELERMQLHDGGWPWYPSMPTSTYITTRTATLLQRAQQLTPDTLVERMLHDACAYVQCALQQEWRNMQQATPRAKPVVADEEPLHMFHLLSAHGDTLSAEADSLLALALRHKGRLTLAHKARLALAAKQAGYTADADTLLRSVLQYSVATPAEGRYFLSPRAKQMPHAYRIDAQCAAIVAFETAGMHREADEMRQWLLGARRGQQWLTLAMTAEALHSLLFTPSGKGLKQTYLTPARSTVTLRSPQGQVLRPLTAAERKADHAPSVRHHYAWPAHQHGATLQLQARREGDTWLTVQWTGACEATQVPADGSDLRLTAYTEVWTNGQWQRLHAGAPLQRGMRLRTVYTLHATRDLSYVQVSMPRAACLEPGTPLSGYAYDRCGGFFREVYDDRTVASFYAVPRGTLSFSETCDVTRAGTYLAGATTAQCAFAPEFDATLPGHRMRVQ